jgi:serine/threonine protein kinase/tetratricopeptide (TPR) repeat protein
MPIPAQSTLGHYEIIAPIGAGGMGEVYRARDKNLDRIVALKILSTTETSGQALRRFIQEAKAASALNHPNIAHIYEIGEADGIPFIAMEYVEGESLQQRIGNGALPSREVIHIGCQMAEALDHAHHVGIIHRDIKSSNIMLTRRGQAKILDFGLAKIRRDGNTPTDADSETQLKTAPEVVLGTLPYMSPEQTLAHQVDHRSDIFSLGIVLYQLTTGHLPFLGKTAQETANLIATAQPQPISRFNYDAPLELERIIRKCLEKERERRYQSAAELGVDLENLKRDSQTSGLPKAVIAAGPVKNKRVALWLAILVLVVLASGIGIYFWRSSNSQGHKISSIAVLPFVNASGDQTTEYFSDGITESIINSLSQLPGTRVMARATMFRYKGKDVDARAVGRELGVDAVVTGRALQQGDTLVVQAELMNVSDGSQLWGDRFNRKLADVLAIQDEIAKQIAENLRLRLSGEQERLLTKRYTDNAEAYDLYLKGRFFYAKMTDDDLQKSIDYYQQAIVKDPSYALAYVGVANSYFALGGVLGFRSPTETYPKMKEYALKALAMDDQLVEAHHIMANTKLYYEWNWADAERELKKAAELNPNYSPLHNTYGTYYQSLRRFDEAVAERRRAKATDPFSPFAVADVGYPLYYARRYDEAIDSYREALELDKNFSWAHLWIGQALVQKGMYEEAIAEIKDAIRLSGGDVRARATLGHAYAVAGKRAEALQILDELKALSKQRYVSPYFIALVYVGLKNDDEAFAWLEKAYEERHPYLILMDAEPVFDQIRRDPRFVDLTKRVGIKD